LSAHRDYKRAFETMIHPVRIQNGFTLVELAIVLVIVSVLIGSFIGTLTARIENAKKIETREELGEIKQAMMAYAFVNGSLPCPDCDVADGNCVAGDVGDGIADFNVTECKENEGAGNVPWVTLGLGRSDAWGTHYRYAVQNAYADQTTAFTLDNVPVGTGPAGTAIIQEPDFSIVTVPPGATPKNLATGVVAIIFSAGKNSYGGISEDNIARPAIPAANLDELNNDDDDQFYYIRPETTSEADIAGKEFDDIVIWISEYELKAKMVEAGALP